MTTENSSLYDMAVFAEAAYVLWENEDGIVNFNSESAIKEALQASGEREGNFTQEQADYFVTHW